MNLFKRWRCLGLGMLFSALPVVAQAVYTCPNGTRAEIIITPLSDLAFGGGIGINNMTTGNIVIDPSGAISFVDLLPGTQHTTRTPARISITTYCKNTATSIRTPAPGMQYLILWNNYSDWVTLNPGGNAGAHVFISNYGLNTSGQTQCIGTTGPDGTDTFSLGGSGEILSGWEPVGYYSNSMPINFAVKSQTAQNPTVRSSTSSASIPISLYIEGERQGLKITAASSSLNFGEILPSGPGGTAGTVTLTPASPTSCSSSGGVTRGDGTSVTVPIFTVSGEPYANYTISIPPVYLSGPGAQMLVTFSSSPSGAGQLVDPPDYSGGPRKQTLIVGGTLTVGVNQTEGNYAGTFSVIVSYF